MANTSSFIIGKEIVKNSACFAALRYDSLSKRKAIIIEKDKQLFGIDFIKSYIEDLIELKFKIEKYIIDKNGDIIIDINKDANKGQIVVLSMAIRYLWEGRYNPRAENKFIVSTYDNYKPIIDAYRKIKSFKWKNLNKLQMLCLAHNVAMVSEIKGRYNYNHCWVESHYVCMIKRDLSHFENKNNYYVNGFFSNSTKKLQGFISKNKNLSNKKAKDWIKRDIKLLLEYCK